MRNGLDQAFATGYESLVVWSDLLDRINVFPVADGDTGTNLRISLAPLRTLEAGRTTVVEQLARSATGNSGNIAAAFFREFVRAGDPADLAAKAVLGRDRAWQAVGDPRPGTMLSVFEILATVLEPAEKELFECRDIEKELRQTVLDGMELLPELQAAGVVDAGALAMFVFFNGFFRQLSGSSSFFVDVPAVFPGMLRLNRSYLVDEQAGYCVDVVLRPGRETAATREELSALGESVVVVEDAEALKVHVHTPDPDQLRRQLTTLGTVTGWSDEPIDIHKSMQLSASDMGRTVHLMTDAAGSLTREQAREHGITLLDSYIVAENVSRPESLCAPEELYALVRTGARVTTAQASIFQRHLQYEAIRSQYEKTLYLCVGSAFTGNYSTVMAWKKKNDPDDRLQVLDTGAASGRLGLIALLTARYAEKGVNPQEIAAFAHTLIADCREFVFIDELKYLVAGGRVSKTGGFFGDLLHIKPVISPEQDGVREIGVVHSRQGQLDFALEKLAELSGKAGLSVVLLQYSDNKKWVAETVRPKIKKMLPKAEVFCLPLSLTSGVHMGPGTWAVACAPVFVSRHGHPVFARSWLPI